MSGFSTIIRVTIAALLIAAAAPHALGVKMRFPFVYTGVGH